MARARERPDHRAPAGVGVLNVLLVDDDPTSRAFLSAALAGEGRRVLTAADGEAGWELCRSEKVRLIVSDWRMPKVDGLELCRRVRGLRAKDYTYFILVTAAEVAPSDYQDAMRAQVDDFLIKPLDVLQIRLRLHAAQRLLAYANRLSELENIIPVCAYCRRLRDDQHAYHQMESYFEKHAGVLFSHGICPDCFAKHLGDSPDETGRSKAL